MIRWQNHQSISDSTCSVLMFNLMAVVQEMIIHQNMTKYWMVKVYWCEKWTWFSCRPLQITLIKLKEIMQHTEHWSFLSVELESCKSVRVSMLNNVHSWMCLQLVPECLNWILYYWKKVIWSDESFFLLNNINDRVCFCHCPGDMMSPGCTIEKETACCYSLRVWALSITSKNLMVVTIWKSVF